MDSITKLCLSLVLCFAVEYIASYATRESVKTWYVTLDKPFWTPPNWVFPVAWTFLYLMMAIALWIAWSKSPPITPLMLFGTQLFLNLIWSPAFFTLQNPLPGMIIIALLWCALLAAMVAFWPYSPTATYLLVPYLLWITYAASLNVAIWWMNPHA